MATSLEKGYEIGIIVIYLSHPDIVSSSTTGLPPLQILTRLFRDPSLPYLSGRELLS